MNLQFVSNKILFLQTIVSVKILKFYVSSRYFRLLLKKRQNYPKIVELFM